MKYLILITLSLISTYAFSCSCPEMIYFGPSIDEAIEKFIEKEFKAKAGENKALKYYPTIFERIFSPKPSERNGANCWSNGPQNEPMILCQAKRKFKINVDIPELGCDAILKVNRKSKTTKAKLVSHTCQL